MNFFMGCALKLKSSDSCELLEYLANICSVENNPSIDQEKHQWITKNEQRPEVHYFKAFFLIEKYFYLKNAHSNVDLSLLNDAVMCFKKSIEKFGSDFPVDFLNRIIDKLFLIVFYHSIKEKSFLIRINVFLSNLLEKSECNTFFKSVFLIAEIKNKLNKIDESEFYFNLLKRKFSVNDFIEEGKIQRKFKNFLGAEKLWDMALEKDHENKISSDDLAIIAKNKFNLKKFEEAGALFARAFPERSSKIPEIFFPIIGETQFYLGHFQEAEFFFLSALMINENIFSRNRLRIFILNELKLNNFKVIASIGKNLLKKLIERPFSLEENYHTSLIGIVAVSKHQEYRYKEAEVLFEEEKFRFEQNALVNSNSYSDLISAIGANKLMLEKYAEAAYFLDQAIELSRDRLSFELLIHAGRAHQELGDFLKAEKLWDMALQMDHNNEKNSDHIISIANNKAYLGKFEEATSLFDQAIEIIGDSVSHELLIEAGMIALKSGNLFKADSLWDMALIKEREASPGKLVEKFDPFGRIYSV